MDLKSLRKYLPVMAIRLKSILLGLIFLSFVVPYPLLAEATSPSPGVVPATGSLSGTIAYPSEGVPPLLVYAFQADDYSKFHKVETAQNQSAFTISNLTPGSYVVVAYPKSGESLQGGFTKAVACGLLASCTDHSLVKVNVTAGKTNSSVEIKDWYAPDNAFPPKPR